MPRQRTRQPGSTLGDMTHPDSFGTLHVGFLNWLKDRNYSVATIQRRRGYLNTSPRAEQWPRALAAGLRPSGTGGTARPATGRIAHCGPGTAGSSASGASSTTWR